jgi:hypothetical protein
MTIASDSDGNLYDGDNATLLALTDADIAELETNYPHQNGLSQDQYDRRLAQAYWLRHMNDNIDEGIG